MTPTEYLSFHDRAAAFKAARKALGMSQREIAAALRVSDGRTVRRWEAGDRDVPGPAEVAVAYMLERVA